ncbi:Diphthine methyltransferase [Orchesella cincta]|uniref:Diphthine methyltransferase n=1 Tax=Orchesella cincta TaxID=48709 RepID=A0A1D2MGJ7_ORCCI|nr:Diphthine methyltransferase [Orchesella cincta]
MSESEITTLINEKLSMQLDCVSWNKKFDVLAVGAYMIDPTDSTKRVGKVFLIQLKLEANDNDKNWEPYKIIQEVNLSGVLDLRWEPENQMELAVATSSSMDVYKLLDSEKLELNLVDSLHLDSMALYTQWMDPVKLIFSDSDGVLNIATTTPLKIETSKKIHDNLTWVVQYSPGNNLVFAGSDEGKFTGFLLENIEDEEKHFVKKFQVGVTSILFLSEKVIAVGSYDDTLRIFSIDHMNPIVLSLKKKIEFGGAVWRTISLPYMSNNSTGEVETDKDLLLVAACARNGIHLVHLNLNDWSFDTKATCLEHEGFLGYGLDVKLEKTSKTCVIASCYFDNHQLHVWKTQPFH